MSDGCLAFANIHDILSIQRRLVNDIITTAAPNQLIRRGLVDGPVQR